MELTPQQMQCLVVNGQKMAGRCWDIGVNSPDIDLNYKWNIFANGVTLLAVKMHNIKEHFFIRAGKSAVMIKKYIH